MGYFAALAITLFLAAFVLITVINGDLLPVYAWDKIRSEPWHTTPQNSTKAR